MALFVIQQGLFVWTIWLWSRKGLITGADPGLFLGGGALVPCSTSTPINHIVFFFLQNTSCIRGGGWHFRLIRCCFCYVAVALSFSVLCRGSKGQGENERAQNLFGTHCFRSGNPIDWFSSDLENWCLKVFVICFISQLMKRSKHGLYVFPPKKTLIRRRHCSISQSYCSMTSKRKYRLISRKFSGSRVRSKSQSNRYISVCFCFCFVRTFSFQGHTKIALTPHWSSAEETERSKDLFSWWWGDPR